MGLASGAISAARSQLAQKLEEGSLQDPTNFPQRHHHKKGTTESCEAAPTPSRQCSASPFVVPDDRWLVLPLHHQGHQKRSNPRVLFSMREALHESQVVAGPAKETAFLQQAGGRPEAQDAETKIKAKQGQTGVGSGDTGTLWSTTEGSRVNAASTGPEFDRDGSSPSGACRRHPGQACEDRPTPEDAGYAGSYGESRGRRPSLDGKYESFAEGSWRIPTAEPTHHTQDRYTVDQSREGTRCLQSPTCSLGRPVGAVARVHGEQVHGAGHPLQGEERPTVNKTAGMQRQNGDHQGKPQDSGECVDGGRSGTTSTRTRTFSASECVPELQTRTTHRRVRRGERGYGRDRREPQNQRGKGQDCSSSPWSSITPEEAERVEGRKAVAFQSQVKVIFYDWEAELTMMVHSSQLPRWRCKPWSLHGGEFTTKMQDHVARFMEPTTVESPLEQRTQSQEDDAMMLDDSKVVCKTENDVDEGFTTFICTYGLAGAFVGRRDRRVRVQGSGLPDRRAQLHDHVRALWHDYGDEDLQVHFIDYVDASDPCEHVVVELLPRMVPEADVPVLWVDKAFGNEGELRVRKLACYVPRRSHVQQVIQHAGRQHVCDSLVNGRCILKHTGAIVLPDANVQARDGDYFECLYDVDGIDDVIALLQRPMDHCQPTEASWKSSPLNEPCDGLDMPTDFQAERLDFDPAVAAIRQQSEETGRQPPIRIFYGRQLLQEWCDSNRDDDPKGLWLQTYGLHYEAVGNRNTQVDHATIDAVMEAINDLWQDYAEFDHQAYAVHPQPDPIDSTTFHVLIEFMQRGESPPHDHVPVVKDWMDWVAEDSDARHYREAQYLDNGAQRHDLLRDADWNECEPSGNHVCEVWIGNEVCPPQGRIGATPGHLIVFTRHHKLEVPEGFDLELFPDILGCLRVILSRRLGRPGMSLMLVAHVVDLFGNAQGWRAQEVERTLPHDPIRLLQELLHLWPGDDFDRVIFFPHLFIDNQEEYHFALVRASPGYTTVLVHGEIGHVDGRAFQSFHHAVLLPIQTTLEVMMQRLNLIDYLNNAGCQIDLQCHGLSWTFEQPSYDGQTFELTITSAGQTVPEEAADIDELDAVEQTTEAEGSEGVSLLQLSSHLTKPGAGAYQHLLQDDSSNHQKMLDFKPVHDFLRWFDAIRPLPQWALPNQELLHPLAQPWSMLDWWDLGPCEQLAFYTDGSTQAAGSGSAAVLSSNATNGNLVDTLHEGSIQSQLMLQKSKPCSMPQLGLTVFVWHSNNKEERRYKSLSTLTQLQLASK